jgi:hypothetical protein
MQTRFFLGRGFAKIADRVRICAHPIVFCAHRNSFCAQQKYNLPGYFHNLLGYFNNSPGYSNNLPGYFHFALSCLNFAWVVLIFAWVVWVKPPTQNLKRVGGFGEMCGWFLDADVDVHHRLTDNTDLITRITRKDADKYKINLCCIYPCFVFNPCNPRLKTI